MSRADGVPTASRGLVDRRVGATDPARSRDGPRRPSASATARGPDQHRERDVEHDRPGLQPRDHTFAAPTTICATKRTSAERGEHARAPSSGRSSCGLAPSTHSTSRNAASASTRCRNIGVVTPPSVGTSRPSISGQSLERQPRLGPLRPDVRADEQQGAGRRRPTRASVARSRCAADRSIPAAGGVTRGGRDVDDAGDQRRAPRRSARSPTTGRARCATTLRAERPPGRARAGTTAIAGQRIRARPGGRTRRGAPARASGTITRNANARCENSISECTVPLGKSCPGWQLRARSSSRAPSRFPARDRRPRTARP